MAHIDPGKCQKQIDLIENALNGAIQNFTGKYNGEFLNKPTCLVFELDNDPLNEIKKVLSHLNSDQLQTLYNNRNELLIEIEKQLLLKYEY